PRGRSSKRIRIGKGTPSPQTTASCAPRLYSAAKFPRAASGITVSMKKPRDLGVRTIRQSNTRLKQGPVVFSYCRVRIHSVQPGLAVPAQWSRYEDLWLDK